jgi:fructose/tagatose bisphosphate aldolase
VRYDTAGVDNTDVAQEDLYSKPEEIYEVYTALNKVAPGMFSIAAAFGNVHGVYKPGNVKLTPEILGNAQKYIVEKEGLKEGSKPVYFVFHGGSGSTRAEIREAIGCVSPHPPPPCQPRCHRSPFAIVARGTPHVHSPCGGCRW